MTVAPYGWLTLGGLAVSLGLWRRLARRDPRLLTIYFAALAGAFLGAKLVYVFAEGYLHFGAPDLWQQLATGKSVLGGLLGGYAAVECVKRLLGYSGMTGDWFALIVPVGILLGRLGCWMSGCCQGIKCRPAWYTISDSFGQPRWPAVPMEILFNLLALVTILWLRRTKRLPTQHFHLYLIGYGAFRFLHEFLREEPRILGPFSGYQIAALAVLTLGAARFVSRCQPSQTPLLALVACFALCPEGLGRAADAAYYGVLKSTQFEQTLASDPTLLASNAYAFTALVVPSADYAVTNATFKAPNAATTRGLTLTTNGDFLQYTEVFQTSAELDAAYPSSTLFFPSIYRFTFGAVHNGTQTGAASYLLCGTPPTPRVANLPEAQDIDTTADLTLRWTPMGGGLLGIVQLLVLDVESNVVYLSPAPFTPNALGPNSTSGTIPANTLVPETNLIGHLVFAQVGLPDTNSYPGAIGVASIVRDTAFPLITRPPPMRPLLEIVPNGSTPALVTFSGETNRRYHIQGSTNLVASAWMDLLVTNAATASFTDTQAVTLPQRYYRVQVGP